MMASSRHCPALFISAGASGQGKTTLTAALARFHTRLGRQVRVFKTGPDFIDPMILSQACGLPVHNLDLWMGGEAHCQQLLWEAAGAADLILVEGVMGLFDGRPSSADLAARFGLPVLAVIDASAMAQTFAAIAHGLATFRSDITLAGAFANRVGSQGHAAMLQTALPATLPFAGFFTRDSQITLPERHLGLLQASEITDLQARIDAAANQLTDCAIAQLPAPVTFAPPTAATTGQPCDPLLQGLRIAIASDAAFGFVYQANLDTLRALGASLQPFSPLAAEAIPVADALYLPGGYPELHADTLAGNGFFDALHDFHQQGKPIVAECGGMLTLLDTLTDREGRNWPMAGLLRGAARMQPTLAALALQAFSTADGAVHGHTFHFSQAEIAHQPMLYAQCPNGGRTAEVLYRAGNITASYVHSYFPSNPAAIARWFLPVAD